MTRQNYLFLVLLIISISCKPPQSTDKHGGYYDEKHRPQFHFTPEKNWMNDPNGMVFYEGEYHLFYQHYPDGNVWGPMHWGHAVSSDLLSWQHLPVALFPDRLGMIFSGSAVVDENNTSGFGTDNKKPLVAIFTQHLMEGEKTGRHDFQTQSVAFSLDKGRTWKMYDGNPVIKNAGKHDFRDPKVFWHQPTKRWKMILAVKDHVELYESPDLKSWRYLSDFGVGAGAHGGVWECPDLFEMKLETTQEKKWIMLVSINPGAPNGGSGTQYFIGQFDGQSFIPDSKNSYWIDQGKDNYAGVTWSDVKDGRRLFLGWMSNWQYANVVPTEAWRGATTVPRALTLVETEQGIRLASNPVSEIVSSRKDTIDIKNDVNSGSDIKLGTASVEINVTLIAAKKSAAFQIKLSNKKGEYLTIGLDTLSNQFYIDRTASGAAFAPEFEGKHVGKRSADGAVIGIKLLIDVSSVELFADQGTLAMTDIFFPTDPFSLVTITPGKGVVFQTASLHHLKSIWKH